MSLRHVQVDQIATVEATLKILTLKEWNQNQENLTQKFESSPIANVINKGMRFSSMSKISTAVQAADQSKGSKGDVANISKPND